MRPDPPAGEPDGPLPDGPLPDGTPLVVPDDASSLARDAEALRRERAAAARRSRLLRMARGRTGQGVGAPLIAAVLLSVGVFAALPVVLAPDLSDDPPARPLARPAVAPGAVGGLLPDVPLQAPSGELAARDTARPGVLVLVPTACGCDPDVEQAVLQSREFTRNVRLVTDGRDEGAGDEAVRLRQEVSRGLARSATDPTGALATAYAARGTTVVVVADDGVVLDVLRDVREGQRLEARLSVLQPPTGSG